MGEPLLHPELDRMLDIARSHGFRVCITTNGTLLGKQQTALLAASGLHKVNVSLHAFEANDLAVPFEEYLDVCKEYGMTAIIDMKYSKGWSKTGEDEYVNQILDAIESKGMMDSCVIQTNNHHDITNIRNNSSDA